MRTALYALLATLALAAPAAAAPSVAESLAIADAWATETVPELPNHCSGGRLAITWDSAAVDAVSTSSAGFADGWAWNGHAWEWDHARCTATIRAELQGTVQGCRVITHELLHSVIGPQHEGPLDPRHPPPPACEPQLAARRTTGRVRARRYTRRYTRRSRASAPWRKV